MDSEEPQPPGKRQEYFSDGRKPVGNLIKTYLELELAGWKKELICMQSADPIFCFISPAAHLAGKHQLRCFWALGGIHGEEPAPPDAFSEEIETFKYIGHKVPLILLPLLNPFAHRYDFRYENEYRDFSKGKSVTSCAHLLTDSFNQPRSVEPESNTNRLLTDWLKENVYKYPPLLVIDHHEDRVPDKLQNLDSCYAYIKNKDLLNISVAQEIIGIFKKHSLPVTGKGETRFGEEIQDGLVVNQSDNSIDEFLYSSNYFDSDLKVVRPKPSSKIGLVIETTIPYSPAKYISLRNRINAHREIIQNYYRFWNLIYPGA